MQMNPSRAYSITIPGTPTNNPAQIAIAQADRPMRAVVLNVGGAPVRIAFNSSALGGITSDGVDHFLLLAGKDITFSLAPKDTLYAVGVGATGSISVHTSDALPFNTPVP